MKFSPKSKHKKKKKHQQNNYKKQDNTNIPVQKVSTPKINQNQEKIKQNCPCNKKGWCIFADRKCVPYALKCKYNKEVFKNNTFYYPTESANKTNTSTKKSSYNLYEDERHGSNKVITTLSDNSIVELYVFKGFLQLNPSQTIDYEMTIKDLHTNRTSTILVAYNKITGKYYISETQIKYWHKRNFFPKIVLNMCNVGSIPMITDGFQEFSKLALYGYKVGTHGLNEIQRHKILKYVIDNKIMRGYEIIKHLQGLIFLRNEQYNKDFSTAIEDWENDIIFIEEYIISKSK